MAYRAESREVTVGAPRQSCVSSLHTVMNCVLQSDSLSPRQRQDVASALRTLARLLKRPLSTLPCDVRSVRGLLEGIAPARHGIRKGRWANIRSLVYKALDLAGVRRLPGRLEEAPSPAWLRLLEHLPYRPYRVALLPFARHCEGQGVEPHRVCQPTFDAFGLELEEYSGRTRPREAFLDACRAWNKCGEAHNHWPAFRVRVQHRRDHYAFDWDAFPPSLKADVDAMLTAAISRDAVTPTSERPIKQVSADSRESKLRAFASALVRQGRDPSTICGIADLVQVDAVKLGLNFIHERANKSKIPHLHQMAKLMCTLARHWVRVPKDHLDQLQSIRKHLKPRDQGMTEKNRAVLRCFEDERLVDGFLALPERLSRRYRRKVALKISEAVELQIALAIELPDVRAGALQKPRHDQA